MATILIVEDDPLMSRMYQKIFALEGLTVELAADGEEGLAKTRSVRPDVVLLDIMMPKLNGLQVLEQLKADPELKSIPVVILTNLTGEKEAETALMKGAIKYIIKSEHEPQDVFNQVMEVIAGNTHDQVSAAS